MMRHVLQVSGRDSFGGNARLGHKLPIQMRTVKMVTLLAALVLLLCALCGCIAAQQVTDSSSPESESESSSGEASGEGTYESANPAASESAGSSVPGWSDPLESVKLTNVRFDRIGESGMWCRVTADLTNTGEDPMQYVNLAVTCTEDESDSWGDAINTDVVQIRDAYSSFTPLTPGSDELHEGVRIGYTDTAAIPTDIYALNLQPNETRRIDCILLTGDALSQSPSDFDNFEMSVTDVERFPSWYDLKNGELAQGWSLPSDLFDVKIDGASLKNGKLVIDGSVTNNTELYVARARIRCLLEKGDSCRAVYTCEAKIIRPGETVEFSGSFYSPEADFRERPQNEYELWSALSEGAKVDVTVMDIWHEIDSDKTRSASKSR